MDLAIIVILAFSIISRHCIVERGEGGGVSIGFYWRFFICPCCMAFLLVLIGVLSADVDLHVFFFGVLLELR